MRSPDAILLAAPNPFDHPVARIDPDLPPPPDVATIHAAVRAELRQAIAATGGAGRAQMVLVTGDPGMGKTHELICMQREAQRAQRDFYFVNIPPLKDATTPFRHLLQQFTQGLAGQQQLDRLLWESLRRVARALREAAWRDGDEALTTRLDHVLLGQSHMVDAFAAMMEEDRALADLLYKRGRSLPPLSSLAPAVGRVLCKLPDPEARPVISEWLRAAELAPDDLAPLGVQSWLDSEARCFETLQALVKLCPTPVALCFDQLEAVGATLGVTGLVALFNALMEVYQQLPVCIVLMCQTQQWGELRAQLPQAAVERVRVLPPLERPTGEQAVRLVAGRMAPLWEDSGVAPPYPSYPFSPEYLDDLVRRTRPALRQILLHCGERLEEMRRAQPAAAESEPPPPAPPPPSAAQVLAAVHARQLDGHHELETPVQRQERLRSLVTHLLGAAAETRRSICGVGVAGILLQPRARATGPLPPFIVTLEGGRRVAVDVSNDKAIFVLKRLVKAVDEEEAADAGVMMREAGVEIGEGPATQENLIALGPGGVVWIPVVTARRMVAGDLLLEAVSASDVQIGDRRATRGEALDYLLGLPDIVAVLAPALGAPPDAVLAERVFALLHDRGPLSLPRVAAALEVDEKALEPALKELTGRGRVMVQRGGQGQALLVLMRGAT